MVGQHGAHVVRVETYGAAISLFRQARPRSVCCCGDVLPSADWTGHSRNDRSIWASGPSRAGRRWWLAGLARYSTTIGIATRFVPMLMAVWFIMIKCPKSTAGDQFPRENRPCTGLAEDRRVVRVWLSLMSSPDVNPQTHASPAPGLAGTFIWDRRARPSASMESQDSRVHPSVLPITPALLRP